MTLAPPATIAQIRQQYVDGSCKVVDFIEKTLEQIRLENDELNAFTHVAGQTAIEQAERLDAQRSENQMVGPLHGVPVAVKDNIDVRGMPTTAGISAYRNRIAFSNAEVVKKLTEAGAVVVGKTNLPEGALGASTENELFGATDHPSRRGYSVGGSSGGSACAVARHLVPVALGTDTLGSVRIPSAYCGVVGLKPSNGLVSLRGSVPLHPAFDTIGPIASTCEDLRVMLDCIGGYDPQCEVAQEAPVDERRMRESLVGFRVVVADNVGLYGCDDAVVKGYDRVIDELVYQGAEIVGLPLEWDLSELRRHALVIVEHSAAKIHADMRAEYPAGFGQNFCKMLDFGADASDQRLMFAREAVNSVREDFNDLFSKGQMVVLPTAPQLPFDVNLDPPVNQADLTTLANLIGCPSLSIPCADEDGLFAAVQLMMPQFSDNLLLKLGAIIDKGMDI